MIILVSFCDFDLYRNSQILLHLIQNIVTAADTLVCHRYFGVYYTYDYYYYITLYYYIRRYFSTFKILKTKYI